MFPLEPPQQFSISFFFSNGEERGFQGCLCSELAYATAPCQLSRLEAAIRSGPTHKFPFDVSARARILTFVFCLIGILEKK